MSDVSLGPSGLLALLLLLDWACLGLIGFIPISYIFYLLKQTKIQNAGKVLLSAFVGIAVSFYSFSFLNALFNTLATTIPNILPGIIPPLIIGLEIIFIIMHFLASRSKKKQKKLLRKSGSKNPLH